MLQVKNQTRVSERLSERSRKGILEGKGGEVISLWGQSEGLLEGSGRERQGFGSMEFRARTFEATGTA